MKSRGTCSTRQYVRPERVAAGLAGLVHLSLVNSLHLWIGHEILQVFRVRAVVRLLHFQLSTGQSVKDAVWFTPCKENGLACYVAAFGEREEHPGRLGDPGRGR